MTVLTWRLDRPSMMMETFSCVQSDWIEGNGN